VDYLYNGEDSQESVDFNHWRIPMQKLLLAGTAVLGVAVGFALAEPVHDWHDIEAVRVHVHQAIQEVQDVRVKNNFDMAGHGVKAEDFLKQAEKELQLGIEAAKRAK
jgi:hypothetical protein